MPRAASVARSRKGRNRSRTKRALVERLREATDEGAAISVYQIQERMNGDKYLFPICQFRLTLEGRIWHLYWMRKFDAWWPYPSHVTGRQHTLRTRMQQVLGDDHGYFWG